MDQIQSSSNYSFPNVLFTVVIVFFFTLIFLMVKKRWTISSKLPPGPWKLPIIGNMHQMVGALPHHIFRDLSHKYGALMHVQLGEVSSIVVSSSEMAKQVMKQHDIKFASRPPLLSSEIMSYGCKNIAFSPYGDYWRQLRKICTLELLSCKRVQSFRWIREEEVSNLVDSISSSAEAEAEAVVNLTEKLFELGFTVTSRTAFGKKSKDHDRFIVIVKEVMKLSAGFHIGDIFPSYTWLHHMSGMRPKLERMRDEADAIMNAIIQDHIQINNHNPSTHHDTDKEDLIDVLIKFVDQHDHSGFSLTLDNIKAVILDIFAAGSETSATTVDWAMAEMMKNPRILNKAQSEVRNKFDKTGRVEEDGIAELQYLHLVIKETLRLHPPGTLLLPRECTQGCVVGGFEIPVKTKVIVNAWAIGRDPQYWEEPEIFYPERFVDNSVDFNGNHFEYIPFGAGRRMCPGVSFGLKNVECQLAMLLYHFDWKLPNSTAGMKNNEELDMTESFGLTVRRKNDLYLVPTSYHPTNSKGP